MTSLTLTEGVAKLVLAFSPDIKGSDIARVTLSTQIFLYLHWPSKRQGKNIVCQPMYSSNLKKIILDPYAITTVRTAPNNLCRRLRPLLPLDVVINSILI